MKTYGIYIKNHEGLDYEDHCSAENKEGAANIFAERINKNGGDWSELTLVKYVEKVNS